MIQAKQLLSRLLWTCLIGMLCIWCGSACEEKKLAPSPVIPASDYLSAELASANQMDITASAAGHYLIKTTGSDPYIHLSPLKQANGDDKFVFTFEYKSSARLSHLQVFLGAPVAEDRSLKTGDIEASSGWRTYAVDLGDQITAFSWGRAGHFLRLDFGDLPGVTLEIRNIQFRKRNAQEEQLAREREEFRLNDQQWNDRIAEYLKHDYPDKVASVDVTADRVRIAGIANEPAAAFLAEITPYDELTEMPGFEKGVPLEGGPFAVELDRYVDYDGFRYDRALSKWAVVDAEQASLRSHARFADRINAQNVTQPVVLAGRKGLGGYAYNRGFATDLDDLSISSATVNITVTSLLRLDAGANTFPYAYNGKTYHINRPYVEDLDKTLQTTASKGIVVSAIILVQKASEAADPKVGELLQHAHFSGGGAFFTMPRLDQVESVHAYAATLDFLANRYSRPDGQHGRIHKWILHNEVDVGTVWTNMGKGRPLHVFLDAYYKSMRLCYTIARGYDAHAEVLASFTHSWAEPAAGGDYATLDMINGLLDYSRTEGDFQWGLACHPYPEDLNEPKTWNDPRATHSMRTPLVTFKNLEVLDAWIKQPAHQFQQSAKRTLWLSENGTNSRSYGTQDLLEQAAGFAYAWKQFKHLDGIDAMQWHNWIDNRHEFGLHIGLRRFPDDEQDPGGKKPVWHAYQAAGTDAEDEVFEPYKAIIGISSWDEVLKGVSGL